MRSGMNAEVFGVVNVRAAVLRNEAPERQIGDVLHRRESEQRLIAREQSIKFGNRIHEPAPSDAGEISSTAPQFGDASRETFFLRSTASAESERFLRPAARCGERAPPVNLRDPSSWLRPGGSRNGRSNTSRR